ncbi:Chromosome segregation protein SMC [Candidatus Desulfarcum epimagneticum]|uniref:Chromosome segregation protein SMC n=1 Tax=uncultured Desulfobacteraceae bacterium TaxID=218296 RepID=A0A484HDP1_9BACT|nr:Chromosome segregation protein SMC [uncultured Desulfobacteraceae bacterium]
MRIDRLDLMAYGPFTGKSLDLSDGNFGLHLIYGDNEAGKSVSLRALSAWLFGVPARTRDNFLHNNPQLRVGGKLRLSDGRTLEFVRRKGNKGAVLEWGGDRALDDSVLDPFLPGGIDAALFSRLWGIDHAELSAGGRELLAQSGDLGQALFSAALGSASLRGILADLKNGAEALFKPLGKKTPVNQAIARFKQARKKIRDAALSAERWERLKKDLAAASADIARTEKAIDEKSKEKSRLDRLGRVRGALAERRAALARLRELGDGPLLPEDFDEKRKTAARDLQMAREAGERARAALSRLEEESASLHVRDGILENEDSILALYRGLGAVEKNLRDRPGQDAKRRLLRGEAETLLKAARPDVSLDAADALRPLLNSKKWISGLARKRALLDQKEDQARRALKDVESLRESIKKELAGRSRRNLDLTELKTAVKSARRAGDADQRLADLEKRAFDEKAACENEFERLGRFPGTAKSLLKASMPMPETLDDFESKIDEWSEKIKEYGRKKQEIEEERKRSEQDLRALLMTSDLPAIADLEEARRRRSALWKLIKQTHIEKIDLEPDLEKEAAALASGSDLAIRYEQKVKAADHVSDQLRLAADQVAKRADLETKIDALQRRLSDIGKKIRKAEETLEIFEKKWINVWGPLGVAPGTPREMKQWLLKVEKLLARLQSADAVSRDRQNLAGEVGRLKDAISLQTARFGIFTDPEKMGLEGMILVCERRLETEEAALEKRRGLERSLKEARGRLEKTRDSLEALSTARSAWQREWTQAVEGLGLGENAHPERAMETLERLAAFFAKYDKSEELRRRIYGMDQVTKEFERRVFDFAESVGFRVRERDAGALASRLNRELTEARETRASLEKNEARRREIKEEIENADITIRNAGQALASLRDRAGVADDRDLAPAGERSRRRRLLTGEIHALERELSRNGDGLGVEALDQEARESDMDAIEGDLESVSSDLAELREKRDALRDRRRTLQNEIQAKDGAAAAADASEEAQGHLADMAQGAERYLRLRIAALILESRLESYRKKNQAPVLTRAGALFSRLTLGAYAGLRDELDDGGKPVLLGVRPDNRETPVDGMSDGARDQLYLALRLAALEQRLEKEEPIPFVADDILIAFDDRRSKKCLEVLSELALRTQVLLFTHHRRVIEAAGEIAGDTGPESGIYIHELV